MTERRTTTERSGDGERSGDVRAPRAFRSPPHAARRRCGCRGPAVARDVCRENGERRPAGAEALRCDVFAERHDFQSLGADRYGNVVHARADPPAARAAPARSRRRRGGRSKGRGWRRSPGRHRRHAHGRRALVRTLCRCRRAAGRLVRESVGRSAACGRDRARPAVSLDRIRRADRSRRQLGSHGVPRTQSAASAARRSGAHLRRRVRRRRAGSRRARAAAAPPPVDSRSRCERSHAPLGRRRGRRSAAPRAAFDVPPRGGSCD